MSNEPSRLTKAEAASLAFLGAADTETGSRYLVQFGDHVQERRGLRGADNSSHEERQLMRNLFVPIALLASACAYTPAPVPVTAVPRGLRRSRVIGWARTGAMTCRAATV